MKTLFQLIEASLEDLPTIYCDLDMVLINFMKGADAAVGGSFTQTDKEKGGMLLIRLKVSGQI